MRAWHPDRAVKVAGRDIANWYRLESLAVTAVDCLPDGALRQQLASQLRAMGWTFTDADAIAPHPRRWRHG